MATTATVKTQFVEANGVKYAYRHLGASYDNTTPLICLQHFRGTIDHWDPALINPLAEHFPVIIVDNAGVGHSTGEVPDSVAGMAKHIEIFLEVLGLTEIYLYGFSLGGIVAQQVALDTLSTGLVKKLMLVGTSPGSGPDTPQGTLEMADIEGVRANSGAAQPTMANMQKLFFYPSETSQRSGEEYWHRIHERTRETSGEERAPYLPVSQNLLNMSKAGQKWALGEGSLEKLHEIKIPVFISNGKSDYMLPTQHSWLMNNKLVNSSLIIYPDSGHGAGFQYAALHAKHIALFLEE